MSIELNETITSIPSENTVYRKYAAKYVFTNNHEIALKNIGRRFLKCNMNLLIKIRNNAL